MAYLGEAASAGRAGVTVGLFDVASSASLGEERVNLFSETWTKYPGNPVLVSGPAGSWDEGSLGHASVMFEGGSYRMWYSGCRGSLCSIGLATSPDGVAWTKHPSNPVVPRVPGTWEPTIANPYVIRDGGMYLMWYTGNDPTGIRIGHATSSDGVAWTKHRGNPVLDGTAGSWDQASVTQAVVIREDSSFTMWYSGQAGDFVYKAGRATSVDGVTWAKDAANPIISPMGWEYPRVHPMIVFPTSSGYEMYYTGAFTYVQIGHAVSPDGIAWARDPIDPILRPGAAGEWDDASLGSFGIVDLGTQRRMWYSGYDGSVRRIGLAETPVEVVKPCPRSHGYWKNHAEAWPVTSLDLGAWTYAMDELLSLLRAPSKGDASIILAHQVIAAKLNVAHGSDPEPVEGAIDDADASLATSVGGLPYGVPPSSPEGHSMVVLAELLDDYNNGLLTPDCEGRGYRPGASGMGSIVLPPSAEQRPCGRPPRYASGYLVPRGGRLETGTSVRME